MWDSGNGQTIDLDNYPDITSVIVQPIDPNDTPDPIPPVETFTGSHNVTFYGADYATNNTVAQTNEYGNNYAFDLILSDTGNDTVIGGNANGDTVHAGGGSDPITLGTRAGDVLFGGTGANQSLSVAGANATLTDGTGAHQTLTASGSNSTFNIQHGPSDIINSEGGHNTINVAAFAGTETINGTSTDTLNLKDYAANANVTHLSSTETQIVFSDTGQIIDVSGTTNINYLAPSIPETSRPTVPAGNGFDVTQDLTSAQLTLILSQQTTPDESGLPSNMNNGLDLSHAQAVVAVLDKHLPADGLTPV
jgi:hypothetical protein